MRQRTLYVVLILVTFTLGLLGQDTLTADTTVPVVLTKALSSDSRPGQPVTAKVMQDITIGQHFMVAAGAKVVGHIVEARPAGEGGPQISFRFDRIIAKNRDLPSALALRAIASSQEIHDAQICKSGPDEGISAFSWTTVQVGGNVAYGCGGPVMAGATEVGRFGPDGAVGRLVSVPGSECEAGSHDFNRQQSLWLFSSTACGVYGLGDLQIQNYGRKAPVGEIVLRSPGKSIALPAGTGLLLQVVGDSQL